jgi:hypothetical protein
MQLRHTRGPDQPIAGALRPGALRPGALRLGALIIAAALALAGCGSPAKAKSASSVQNCGTSRTAANVPVQVEVYRGQVSCSVAMTVEQSYAAAIVAGRAPGNGGGGPVTVNGWKCQGFPTPELLKNGDASKCAKDGAEILEILTTPS